MTELATVGWELKGLFWKRPGAVDTRCVNMAARGEETFRSQLAIQLV